MRMRVPVALALLFLTSCNTRLSVESQFTLDPSSRLPRWFTLPPGYARQDVTVRLTYYTMLPPRIELLAGTRGRRLADITADKSCWHPVTWAKRNTFGGFDADSYPHYSYIDVGGVIEYLHSILTHIPHHRRPRARQRSLVNLLSGSQEMMNDGATLD